MKTFTTILSIAFVVGFGSMASAHHRTNAIAEPQSDTVVLATYQEDDYLVKRYLVNLPNEKMSDYSVRYSINVAQLEPDFNGNSDALTALSHFIGQKLADTVARIESITITGYASPDGPLALNERLATQRAEDFKGYVDEKYHLSAHYPLTTKGVAEDWQMCRTLVDASNAIPHKEEVMAILDSTLSDNAKEQELKRMTEVWDFMRTDILPPLRRVEIVINYAQGTIVEERTLIEPLFEEKIVEEVVVPRRCSECGLVGCTCGNNCICNGTGMIIEVDDALLEMVSGVATEVIESELIEVE